jgi:hypothetical protein
MFSLVVSSIEIRHPDGHTNKYINNPLLPEHAAFQGELYKLLSYGLTVDEVQKDQLSNKKILSGESRNLVAPERYNPFQGGGFGGGYPMYGESFYGQQSQYQYKVCIDQNKFSNYIKEEFSPNIFCRMPLTAANSKAKKAELILNLRSTNSIFEYLGQIVAAQHQASPYIVQLPPSETTSARKVGQKNQYALLIVNKNNPASKSFAAVKNLDGNTYTIPSEDNGYSPMVIKIISQLLSLNKIPGSIPSSPGILLR